MKRIITIILIVIGFSASSQNAVVTASLAQKLNDANSSTFFKVNIVFANQVHHGVLNQQFKDNNIPINERARIVIRKSMQMAKNEQQAIIKLLDNSILKVREYKSFWIINMMTIEATKSIIEQLSYLSAIDYIEEYDNYKAKPIEIEKGIPSNTKSVGGIEPGLAAINAPALWAMGYTGKGRRYYSIDTGVWPQHPALKDNWLGNYQPINQAWYGIDSPTPVDKDGTHGTHTAGTVLGLDPATQDTIGVAFNAYFMASDPIVTTAAAIKPLPEYIDVFEFALNPDGDTTTTNDIPDAINNSWGISGSSLDTTICSGYVTQMFDAIEAAGIANVFSAGNSGPTDTTIGQPQYVSTGLVNTFTVGAVNGANTSFPITNFSSHGPTACPLTGPLKIKPEVVAPGLNVRSSIGVDNYALYNGTSMAGPHAAGAVLLLKEAFPNVSGEDILLALYNTAIDLGVAGEDNIYGRGMIDVLAAFNYLSLTYTPIPPNSFKYDISVEKIISPIGDLQCTQTFTPQFILKNKGDSTITSAIITYRLNEESSLSFNWSGTLASGDTSIVNLPAITALTYGKYELLIKATIDTLKIECDYINNQKATRFNIRTNTSVLPYREDFEQIKLDNSDWIVNNPDGETTWDTIPTAGLPNSNFSATMQLTNYNGSKQLDEMIMPTVSLPNQDSIFLSFDLAYQMVHFIIADTMRIYLSDDCGITFNEIYKKGGANLQTHDTVTANFIPIFAHHWRREYVDITSYASSDVIIKFESYNKSGNNLYVDNVWVYEGEEPLGIKENLQLNELLVYPNPTQERITIDFNKNSIENASIQVIDLLGKTVHQQVVKTAKLVINMNNFDNGIYLLRFINTDGSRTMKIIKK